MNTPIQITSTTAGMAREKNPYIKYDSIPIANGYITEINKDWAKFEDAVKQYPCLYPDGRLVEAGFEGEAVEVWQWLHNVGSMTPGKWSDCSDNDPKRHDSCATRQILRITSPIKEPAKTGAAKEGGDMEAYEDEGERSDTAFNNSKWASADPDYISPTDIELAYKDGFEAAQTKDSGLVRLSEVEAILERYLLKGCSTYRALIKEIKLTTTK